MGIQNAQSIADLFLKRVEESSTKIAFHYPKPDDSWGQMTWKEVGEDVRPIACGLLSLGIHSEERCAILSSTRLDWVLADLGVLCASGATTTVYPSNTPDECAYILKDSETRFVFAENDDQVAKLVEKRSELPKIVNVISFDGQAGHNGWVMSLDDLRELGRKYDKNNPGKFDEVVKSVKKEHLATLIYTSGTTGTPKGVELLHDCWLFTGEGIEAMNILHSKDHQYLWLPLSHSFGKVLESAQLQIGFTTSIDGRVDKLVANLSVVQPTFMAAAPRIFEKVYNKVVTGAQAAGGLKYKIFRWALGVGREVSAVLQQRKQPTGLLALKYKIATKLVFSKLQALFGGRIRFFISGSAPLSREMAEFFHAAGILILEGYGLTESSAASFVNHPDDFKFGTVGKPLEGLEVKIAEGDGEILIRGRGIMRGYHNKRDATKETLTADGWLLTGDIGELDGDGSLKITDRKKDLIKTSGGKYVAPQHLEGSLKALCPYISQVLVHGNNRNYCTALVTMDEESIGKWQNENGLNGASYKEVAESPKVAEMVQTAVNELNGKLAKYETIKKFAVLPVDFSIETGELTASMKVKRKVVETKYKDLLDGFYTGAISQV